MSLSDPDLLAADNRPGAEAGGFAGANLTRVHGRPAAGFTGQGERPSSCPAAQRWDTWPVPSAVVGRVRLMLP